MSDPKDDEPKLEAAKLEEIPDDAPESGAMKALLQRSLREKEPAVDEKALLVSVQTKLRKRSKGKFYADGWSTTQFNYALVAFVMLAVIAIVYVILGPTGITR